MDLIISALEANIEASYNRTKVSVTLANIDKDDLDIEDVAKCISIETFFDAHDEDAIRRYVERNYDWFDVPRTE